MSRSTKSTITIHRLISSPYSDIISRRSDAFCNINDMLRDADSFVKEIGIIAALTELHEKIPYFSDPELESVADRVANQWNVMTAWSCESFPQQVEVGVMTLPILKEWWETLEEDIPVDLIERDDSSKQPSEPGTEGIGESDE